MPVSEISGLEYQIMYKGAFAMLQVAIPKGATFRAESDAMVAMSPTLDISANTGKSGFVGAMARKFLSGETAFYQDITGARGDGIAFFAPSYPGDIAVIEMDGKTEYRLSKNAYMAGTPTIEINAKMQNVLNGMMSGQGLFILNAKGKGTLFISSYGALDYVDVPPGQIFIIDNGHLVAWPATMQYEVKMASRSGIFGSIASGEGFVLRMRGPGRVYFQSRNVAAFGSWVKSLASGGR